MATLTYLPSQVATSSFTPYGNLESVFTACLSLGIVSLFYGCKVPRLPLDQLQLYGL